VLPKAVKHVLLAMTVVTIVVMTVVHLQELQALDALPHQADVLQHASRLKNLSNHAL
jgi:hypothetical protein